MLKAAQCIPNEYGTRLASYLVRRPFVVINNNDDNDGGDTKGDDVHDPDSPGGSQGATATLGDLSGFERAVADGSGRFDMVDGGWYNTDKAYKDSKLCNIIFARELQRRLSTDKRTRNIIANSFTPGLIVGTGLFRDQNQVFTKVFNVAATKLLKVGETTHYGGGALEYMTLSAKPGSTKYGNGAFGWQFDVSEVSKEARACDDDGRAKRFWKLSEELTLNRTRS
ncbi:hypothetical protein ACHAXA_006136 [Cyclostephanos tholiformis]|uniref:Uncharacterized protein n=1 Tax=Cyclostephanos tholiformis TaxID=382380 RepID=A0ABD3RER1_9STRA